MSGEWAGRPHLNQFAGGLAGENVGRIGGRRGDPGGLVREWPVRPVSIIITIRKGIGTTGHNQEAIDRIVGSQFTVLAAHDTRERIGSDLA